MKSRKFYLLAQSNSYLLKLNDGLLGFVIFKENIEDNSTLLSSLIGKKTSHLRVGLDISYKLYDLGQREIKLDKLKFAFVYTLFVSIKTTYINL